LAIMMIIRKIVLSVCALAFTLLRCDAFAELPQKPALTSQVRESNYL